MYEVIDRVIDAGSWFEIKRLFAQEIIVGLLASPPSDRHRRHQRR